LIGRVHEVGHAATVAEVGCGKYWSSASETGFSLPTESDCPERIAMNCPDDSGRAASSAGRRGSARLRKITASLASVGSTITALRVVSDRYLRYSPEERAIVDDRPACAAAVQVIVRIGIVGDVVLRREERLRLCPAGSVLVQACACHWFVPDRPMTLNTRLTSVPSRRRMC